MHRFIRSGAIRSSSAMAALLIVGLAGFIAAPAQSAAYPATAASTSPNVLVVDVQADANLRRAWEDAMVASLRRQRIAATPSYRLFPLMAPPVSELTRIVLARHFDHVLATHFSNLAARGWPAHVGSTGYLWLQRYDRYWHIVYGPNGAEAGQPLECQTDIFTVYFAGSSVYWTAVTTPLVTRGQPQTATAQISEAFMEALR